MVALGLQSPRWALTTEESEQVAKAYADMARHYHAAVSAKTIDTLRFGVVLAAVYGTRVAAAARERKKPAKSDGKPIIRANGAAMPHPSPVIDVLAAVPLGEA